ncbi:DOMON-like domain-containing protein [Novosphingobium mangrovi (ex Huang et al. 2023)]|uniref:DOMON-like domain-containing protein n=1 Tax=Novosphingobium mangrovi (ex Huang et al. 2023) TaxID=2976432 RepID=A0ABT2I7K4_9SPHN|nr:DOMON-like domain-containing protein [Novosphingobium mangrovi (ex Huang et al. 2023)]MCT2400774.1 DOMON-like domain-containing protein [Novosphingobium mangrovi (ex Huang et al. 2023)]
MAELTSHPAHPPALVRTMEFRIIGFDANWLRARWKIMGSGKLVVPSFAGKGRAEGLWQTTCFELFLHQPGSPAYTEINLSPSERWNVYDFSARREGMHERPMPREPECTMRLGTDMAIFDAAIPAAGLPQTPWKCGIAAVIEEEGGVKSYWALSHTGDAPDFHDPACFLEEVAAPGAP